MQAHKDVAAHAGDCVSGEAVKLEEASGLQQAVGKQALSWRPTRSFL